MLNIKIWAAFFHLTPRPFDIPMIQLEAKGTHRYENIICAGVNLIIH